MKTIEEAAKDSVSEVLTVKENESVWMETYDLYDYLVDQFKAGVEFAQRWIPVEEELPEVCDFYLTKQSDNIKPHVYYYDVEYKGFFQGKGIQIFTITHWRPIEIK